MGVPALEINKSTEINTSLPSHIKICQQIKRVPVRVLMKEIYSGKKKAVD
jgi:hypothetical protein